MKGVGKMIDFDYQLRQKIIDTMQLSLNRYDKF